MSKLWFAHRSPEPEATSPPSVLAPAEQLPPEGRFGTPWMKVGEVVMPSVCCACGQLVDGSHGMPLRNSDSMGKLYITVALPLCAQCASVRAAAEKAGKWRLPAELKLPYKHIEHSASMKVKRVVGFADDEIRFTFTNRRFAEAFEESQRVRKALLERAAAQQQAQLQAKRAEAAAERTARKEQRAAERAAKKRRHAVGR